MSARRQARAASTTARRTEADGPPAVLLLGRCEEIWADPRAACPTLSAFRRCGLARSWWLQEAGVTSVAEQCQSLPIGAPWSVHRDPEAARDRLKRHGLTPRQIPDLRRQAAGLFATALKAEPPIAGAYHHRQDKRP